MNPTRRIAAYLTAVAADQDGATAAEYALLVALIAIALIASVRYLGGSIATVFNKTSSTLSGATS